MSLTAEDIQTKQFHVRFRGFDIEEVDAFLERIAENFVLLNEEKKELKDKLERLEMEVNKFYSQERTFQHAIVSAQRIADEMLDKSRKESDERRTAAQEEIDRLRQQGREEKERIEEEISTLQEQKNKVKEELRTYLHTYLGWLDTEIPVSGTAPALTIQEDRTVLKNEETSTPLLKDPEGAVSADADEIDDLYEKIELNDDLQPMEGAKLDESDRFSENDEEKDGEQLTIPDLEGDMLFSLEDPLDEEDKEPEVKLESADDKYFQDIKLK